MSLKIVDHPLVRHKLGLIRAANISTKDFRQLVKEIGSLLTYEATRSLELEETSVSTWQGDVQVEQLKKPMITLVPILRAGLGMMDGVLDHLPGASISVVGLYRDEKTLKPVSYFEKLVKDISSRPALVVDPMLATGGSMIATIDLLKQKGCKNIKAIVLVAAPEGVKALGMAHPDIDVYTAALDKKLDENGYIIPGLGDAGDKIFGTLS